jgi:4-carboxymuconolactone decarboxylase
MPANAQARRTHDELFPRHVSTLAETDAELITFFDDFAFDEVLRESRLEARTRLMVQLAALIAAGAVAEYRAMLGAALTVGVTPVEVREIVYQAMPYVGMGRLFDVLHATNESSPTEASLSRCPASRRPPRDPCDKGRDVQSRIIGADRVEALYANAPADEQHIQSLLSANCFGDHYTRTGLDIPTRELLTLSMLVALGGCDPQVRGHVAANLNVGNDRATLIDVVTQLVPFIGYPRTLNALAAIDAVAPTP